MLDERAFASQAIFMKDEILAEQVFIPLQEKGLPQTMGGYWASPAASHSHPLVLVCMEMFGINNHIREITRRLARQGYAALAFDFFHRTAPGIELTYDQKGVERGLPLLGLLKRDEVLRDVQAALSYGQERNHNTVDPVGIVGFCIGGHVAYLAATQLPFAAVASFYGGGVATSQMPLSQPEPTVELTPGMKKHGTHIVCFFGAQDDHITAEQRNRVARALQEAGVSHEIVVYPAAGHGFFCDQRSSFHQPSHDDAWQRVVALFQKYLKGKNV